MSLNRFFIEYYLMDILGSANETYRTQARTILLKNIFGKIDNFRVALKTKYTKYFETS